MGYGCDRMSAFILQIPSKHIFHEILADFYFQLSHFRGNVCGMKGKKVIIGNLIKTEEKLTAEHQEL